MGIFVGSLLAYKKGLGVFSHTPGVISAASPEEAEEQFLRQCEAGRPAAEGWSHHIALAEVAFDSETGEPSIISADEPDGYTM